MQYPGRGFKSLKQEQVALSERVTDNSEDAVGCTVLYLTAKQIAPLIWSVTMMCPLFVLTNSASLQAAVRRSRWPASMRCYVAPS